MTATERDFSNYELSDDVYQLAGGIIPEIAKAAEFELAEQPDAANLGSLVGKIGPDKELQRNISVVRAALGEDSRAKIADWIDRSGIMAPLDRSFAANTSRPETTRALVMTGGVANWMLRRAMHAMRLDPTTDGSENIYVAVGKREMKPAEHQLVTQYERLNGAYPTEAQFADTFLRGMIERAGFEFTPVTVEETDGDKIMDALFAERSGLLDRTITVVSNAPNAIQSAGEFRLAGRRIDPSFDSSGDQVYMYSDSFPLARNGEKPATHQNPETALGQLARNALYLVRNQAT